MLEMYYDAPTAKKLILKAQLYYKQFRAQHTIEKSRNNRTNLNARILPVLSIYTALISENDNQEKVNLTFDF